MRKFFIIFLICGLAGTLGLNSLFSFITSRPQESETSNTQDFETSTSVASTPTSLVAITAASQQTVMSTTTLPYATERNKYWNAKCPQTLRANDDLPLVKCDKGEGVRRVQQLLGVEADSYFGNDTFNALITFQAQAGLPVTGEVDAATWRALDPMQSGPGTDFNQDGLVTPNEFYWD